MKLLQFGILVVYYLGVKVGAQELVTLEFSSPAWELRKLPIRYLMSYSFFTWKLGSHRRRQMFQHKNPYTLPVLKG